MKRILVILLAVLLIAAPAFAAEKGTAKEAQAMVKKAIAFWKANGQDKAWAEFNNPKGQFIDKDLYIYVTDINKNAKIMAHGANKALIGKELVALKDKNGKQFMKELIDAARVKGSGWEEYFWTNPVSKKVEHKSLYYERYDHYAVCCGIYK
ncbi:MAG: cache domain-containing protein [Syntrophales bacterium]|nr:cache domain-containing protein [Syntrophales bacterium]MDD5233629.1 cache domain-containing protein [Syntrophales bacterium]HPL63597.1 cache domain-containing protein [Syntrophales bacterium]